MSCIVCHAASEYVSRSLMSFVFVPSSDMTALAQAVPGKVVDTVEEAIEDAVEDVLEAVEEVASVPGKKLEELGLLPDEGARKKKAPAPPRPPPQEPEPKQKQRSLLPPPDQKLDLPSFSFPKFEEEEKAVAKKPPPPKKAAAAPKQRSLLPPPDQKLDLPSFSFPKFEEEKAAVKATPPPKKAAAPKAPAPAQEKPTFTFPKFEEAAAPKKAPPAKAKAPPAKEKKKDNFVFSETSLKEFIAKDKKNMPSATESDNTQQEAKRKSAAARKAEIKRAAEKAAAAFRPAAKKAVPKGAPAPSPPAQGRATVSLKKARTAAPKVAAKAAAVAPRGVPTISKWKLDPSNNSISGFISGSKAFSDGEPVTTSAIVGEVAVNAVVQTKSGSKYVAVCFLVLIHYLTANTHRLGDSHLCSHFITFCFKIFLGRGRHVESRWRGIRSVWWSQR